MSSRTRYHCCRFSSRRLRRRKKRSLRWSLHAHTKKIYRQPLQANGGISQEIIRFIAEGWPPKKHLASELFPYFAVKDELSYVDGLLLLGERIAIPESYRARLISLAHENHPGIIRTKQLLRDRYWWPCLDKHVESTVRNCCICQAADKSANLSLHPCSPFPFRSNRGRN